MRFVLWLVAFLASIATGALPASAQGPAAAQARNSGVFTSDFGLVVMGPNGGTYTPNGSLEVHSVDGSRVRGIWRQPTSSQRCSDGGYWGRFDFTFTAEGFTGGYSFCDGPTAGAWNGMRAQTGGGEGWGVWASAAGGRWGDPCAIQYNAARIAGNRYDGNPGYRRVRLRDTQAQADLDIDQFGRFHQDQPDGIVKMTSCESALASADAADDRPADKGNAGGAGPAPGVRTNFLEWMTGTFDTGGGVLQLTPAGGTYEYSNGRMTVEKIDRTVMEGRWEQDLSAGKCEDGRYHGRFRLVFTEDGFSGVFGYCDEEPGRIGGFQGTRRK